MDVITLHCQAKMLAPESDPLVTVTMGRKGLWGRIEIQFPDGRYVKVCGSSSEALLEDLRGELTGKQE